MKQDKKVVWKLFWAWQSEAEEVWLNEMSAQGWQLSRVGFCRYVFVPGQPGEFCYRLELMTGHPASQGAGDYLSFLKETGVDCVEVILGWAYLRSRDKGFKLYSDLNSRLAYYRRRQRHLLTLLPIELGVGLCNLAIGLGGLGQGHAFNGVNLGVGLLLLAIGAFLGRAAQGQQRLIRELAGQHMIEG